MEQERSWISETLQWGRWLTSWGACAQKFGNAKNNMNVSADTGVSKYINTWTPSLNKMNYQANGSLQTHMRYIWNKMRRNENSIHFSKQPPFPFHWKVESLGRKIQKKSASKQGRSSKYYYIVCKLPLMPATELKNTCIKMLCNSFTCVARYESYYSNMTRCHLAEWGIERGSKNTSYTCIRT